MSIIWQWHKSDPETANLLPEARLGAGWYWQNEGHWSPQEGPLTAEEWAWMTQGFGWNAMRYWPGQPEPLGESEHER